jgi:hypothetical protein
MFCIDFGFFQTIPSLLVLTLSGRKRFLAFLTFQELRDMKKDKVRENGLGILRQTK